MISFFYIIAVLVVAGLMLWFLGQLPAIDPTMKQLIRAVIIIFAVLLTLWFLFGIFSGSGVGMHMPSPCR